MPRQSKFREKLTLIFTSATLIMLGIAGGGLLLYQNLTIESRARTYLEPYAQLLSVTAAAAADFEDAERAKQILTSLSANPDLLGASIVMQNGRVLAKYQRTEGAGLPHPQPGLKEGIYLGDLGAELVQNIQYESTTVAQLHLWVSKGRLQMLTRQSFWIFGFCVLLLLVAVLILQKVIQKMIIKPISDLAGTANLIKSEASFALRAKVSGDDEVAILARSFNSMLDALQKLSGLQKTIVAHAPMAIISSDRFGVITSLNPAAERMLGYSADEMIGKKTPLVYHDPKEIMERARLLSRPEECTFPPGFEAFLAQTGPNDQNEQEWTVINKDGARISVLLSVSTIHSGSNDVDGYLGMMMDITDRKRAEEEVRRREHRFRTLIENSTDLITVVASDFTITFQSPSCERVLGYKQEQMIGRLATDFIHSDDERAFRLAFTDALGNPGRQVSASYRLRHRDDNWRLIDSVGCCSGSSNGRQEIVINARDVTQSTKLEEQLRQSQKLEAIGQLSGGVAHDFNNLLTVIQMHICLMEQNHRVPVELKDSIAEIKKSADRAAKLTSQLLAFSRRQTMQLKELDLNEIVSQMIRMLRRILGEDIHLQIHCCAQAAMIEADSGMMEQVLLNLVVNARDAMPSGGRLIIETEIVELDNERASSIPSARSGSFVRMSVSDTGTGIPNEHLPKIFEPFFTTKDIGKGTGLGLATVYGIVQQHRGWITVGTESGHGSSFRVYLPRIKGTMIKEEKKDDGLAMPGGTETLLFVEDEPSLRRMGVKTLELLGYTVFAASNGVEAYEIWRHNKQYIRLIVTDLVMPGGINGRMLAEKILADNPTVPVVYCSGYSTDVAGKDLKLREGINFLAKPFRPQTLAKIVRSSLDRVG